MEKLIQNHHTWIWQPHAGHYILGHKCRFRLNTYVNGYIISTVGELPLEDGAGYRDVGLGRKYETMVFEAKSTDDNVKCCEYEQINGECLDMEGYNTPEDAKDGHILLCNRYHNIDKKQNAQL